MRTGWLAAAVVLGLIGCGDAPKKPKSTANNTAENNAANNGSNNTSNNDNNVTPAGCGDGIVDPDETCDSGIASGEGSCPNLCPPQGACTLGRVVGNAASCSATCEYTVVTSCAGGDGCCPAGCDYLSDSDCSATCNNGSIDEGETCDGNCPTSCNDGNACTTDTLTGSATNCSAACSYVPVTQCVDNDGCCPSGCSSANDDDCNPVCGNGLVEVGERCDGNCPSSCNDGNACTADAVSGSAATCNLTCSNTVISACQSGDGCCPAGCTYAVDADCSCQRLSCDSVRECGTPSDGCGGTLNCGGCPTGEFCSNFQCVPSTSTLAIGSPCTQQSNCAGAAPFCVANPNFKDGYCSSECQFDNDCPSGSHCGQKDANTGIGSCLDNCTTDADCRSGYQCYNQDNDSAGSKECLPSATGTGVIGAPCTGVYQCDGDLLGACLLSQDGWPNGYCTMTCTGLGGLFPDECPTGSVCHGDFLTGSESMCLKTCTSSTQCRTGYTCQTHTNPLLGTSYSVCM